MPHFLVYHQQCLFVIVRTERCQPCCCLVCKIADKLWCGRNSGRNGSSRRNASGNGGRNGGFRRNNGGTGLISGRNDGRNSGRNSGGNGGRRRMNGGGKSGGNSGGNGGRRRTNGGGKSGGNSGGNGGRRRNGVLFVGPEEVSCWFFPFPFFN